MSTRGSGTTGWIKRDRVRLDPESQGEAGGRRGSNSSQVADPWMIPRTYLHDPTESRGNIHLQAMQEASGFVAGR